MNIQMDSDERRLRELLGDARYEELANDNSDGDIPTVVVGCKDGGNVFLKFESRREIEFLLYQLSSVLVHNDADLGATLKAKVVPFRETWDDVAAENA